MARIKQTARLSTGGKAPRKRLMYNKQQKKLKMKQNLASISDKKQTTPRLVTGEEYEANASRYPDSYNMTGTFNILRMDDGSTIQVSRSGDGKVSWRSMSRVIDQVISGEFAIARKNHLVIGKKKKKDSNDLLEFLLSLTDKIFTEKTFMDEIRHLIQNLIQSKLDIEKSIFSISKSKEYISKFNLVK
jgi:hypothetical protein